LEPPCFNRAVWERDKNLRNFRTEKLSALKTHTSLSSHALFLNRVRGRPAMLLPKHGKPSMGIGEIRSGPTKDVRANFFRRAPKRKPTYAIAFEPVVVRRRG